MKKQMRIDNNVIPPMPVALVGTVVEGKVNFMTVAWCARANFKPPMIAVAIGKPHHSTQGILENKTFSVCLPDCGMEQVTDYCGIVSGAKKDKSDLFSSFFGELKTAPMINECPVNLECTLAHVLELPSNNLFVGEIVGAFAREDVLEQGELAVEKMHPILLTMPDNRYWELGKCVGKAWKDGLALKRT